MHAMRTPTLVETLPSRLLARLTGASLRSAQRWRSGGTPRAASLARLRETDAVLALLDYQRRERRFGRVAQSDLQQSDV